jgi:hypothetical protein
MSEAAATVARAKGWSAVADDGPAWLQFSGRTVDLKAQAEDSELDAKASRRGRPGYGQFSVMRALLALEGGATQKEIAKFAHVTQPRVSQALAKLRALGLVARDADGWAPVDRHAFVDWWIENYPGPGGLRTYWFALAPIREQAHDALKLLEDLHARPVVSGDVAADVVAPWRTPRQALLYAERGADLSEVRFTPTGPTEATLVLVLPDDHAIWPVGNPSHLVETHLVEIDGVGDLPRAGSLQVLWDLRHGVGPDANEAAAAWSEWMLKDGASR